MKYKIFIICFIAVFLILTGADVQAKKTVHVLSNQNIGITGMFPSIQNKNPANKVVNINNGYGYNDENLAIGYPAVDNLEKRILGTMYPNQNIYIRLNRLEKAVFGKTVQGALSDRVDKLEEIVNKNGQYSTNKNNSNIIFGQNYRENRQYQNNTYNENYSTILYNLEKQTLGVTYPTEPANTRVTRLENKLFAGSSENYPMDERIQRLTAYADAQNSDEYFQDQSQMKKYTTMTNGAKAISILFMVLQFFL